ncbi:hypothetical protein V1521DRAFT_114621 [Lipomyces starkeyi]
MEIDEEAPPEDRLNSSQLNISMDTLPDSDIFPSDSVSTLGSPVDIHAEESRHQPQGRSQDNEHSKRQSKSWQC